MLVHELADEASSSAPSVIYILCICIHGTILLLYNLNNNACCLLLKVLTRVDLLTSMESGELIHI